VVITFPQMGNISLAAKAFFEELRISYVVPENNRLALQTGARVSPDEICLPFKLMMGNYIAAIARGADTVLITGSCGPCRFGEYCELQMSLLRELGLRADFIVLDSPGQIGLRALRERLRRIPEASPLSGLQTLAALRRALQVLRLADALDAQAHLLAGLEAERGACKRLLAECRARVFKCDGLSQALHTLERYRARLSRVPLDSGRRPLRVALVGEIYSMIEPFSNMDIEEKLMDYGVSTSRLITPSWWVKDLVLKPMHLNSRGLHAASRPYLPFGVGGHATETVAHAELCARGGFDGAIQIFPVGCMPEIVAASALPAVRQRHDFPILKLVMDEITGEAGVVTRLEAFLDMLEARRKRGGSREKALQPGY
jgi:predicted nucleotide-binding protein (sugar kinase/HSP70/actin superfamily)